MSEGEVMLCLSFYLSSHSQLQAMTMTTGPEYLALTSSPPHHPNPTRPGEAQARAQTRKYTSS